MTYTNRVVEKAIITALKEIPGLPDFNVYLSKQEQLIDTPAFILSLVSSRHERQLCEHGRKSKEYQLVWVDGVSENDLFDIGQLIEDNFNLIKLSHKRQTRINNLVWRVENSEIIFNFSVVSRVKVNRILDNMSSLTSNTIVRR